jgi:FMN-dependent NADH-azoreductase
MTHILIVESSPRGTESASRKLTDKLRERLEVQYPEARIIERDLVKDKLPHMDQPTLKAISTKDPVEAESLKEAAYLSNQLVDELMVSDLLVIAWDSVEPYLRQILGFIGIEDVQTVRAEGMDIPPLAIHAVLNGEKAVEALVICEGELCSTTLF